MLTASNFQLATSISNALRDIRYPHIAAAMSVYKVDTPLRQAHFLAQTGHESAGLQRTAEVLNYGGNALIAIFGGRITPEHATQYGRNSMHAANTEILGTWSVFVTRGICQRFTLFRMLLRNRYVAFVLRRRER